MANKNDLNIFNYNWNGNYIAGDEKTMLLDNLREDDKVSWKMLLADNFEVRNG